MACRYLVISQVFFSLGQYPIDALENVTVTKGMGGDKHGSRTLGGSFHLQTRRLKDDERFLHLEGGSYDTLRETAGTGLATKLGDFSVVVGRSEFLRVSVKHEQNVTALV